MTTQLCIILSLLIFSGCTHNDHTGDNAHGYSSGKDSATIVENSDTLTIDRKAAVFYSPDSLQIEKRKKDIGEDNFYVGADDYLNYLNISENFLDSVKLPIMDAKDNKYLKFIRDNNSQTVIRLDTLPELWGIYFFDPAKKEKWVDITTIDEEYNSYFR